MCSGSEAGSYVRTMHLADAKAARVELGLGRLDAHLRRVHLPGGGGSVRLAPEVTLEMCSGSEAGSYLRLIDFCITQLTQ